MKLADEKAKIGAVRGDGYVNIGNAARREAGAGLSWADRLTSIANRSDGTDDQSQMNTTTTQLAVCGSLLLAVGLVFGQTVRHEFIDFDDHRYVYENSHVASGFTLSGLWWR